MKILVYLIVFVFGTLQTVSESDRDPNNAYCFQFTWLGRFEPSLLNCSSITTVPCILPLNFTENGSPPSVIDMWYHSNQTAISCTLGPGYACMKYSYIYNNAVLNIAHFCGKMIRDKKTAVSSGCFTQQVSGHAVEVCACRSRIGEIPCNSSIESRHSTKMLIILTLIVMFLYSI